MFLLKKIVTAVVQKVVNVVSQAKILLQGKAENLIAKLESKADALQDKADALRDKYADKADAVRDHYNEKAAEAREQGNEHLAQKFEQFGAHKAEKLEALGEKKASVFETLAEKYQSKADLLKAKLDKGDLKEDDVKDDVDDSDIPEDEDESGVEVKFFVDANGDGNPYYFVEIQAPDDFDVNNPDFDQFFDEVQSQMEEWAATYPQDNLSTDPVTAVIQASVFLPDNTIVDFPNPFADDETMSDLSTGEAADDYALEDESEDDLEDA